MLQLDALRWSTLSHAYGPAFDIPEKLIELSSATEPKKDAKSEPWFGLWSSLCHQGDVYDASYAALPHIVDIACKTRSPIDFNFLLLPTSIEVARSMGRGPPVPIDLQETYSEAVARLTECIALHRNENWDQDMLISAISAQAAAKGHTKIAHVIMNLDDDLIAKLINLDFDY